MIEISNRGFRVGDFVIRRGRLYKVLFVIDEEHLTLVTRTGRELKVEEWDVWLAEGYITYHNRLAEQVRKGMEEWK